MISTKRTMSILSENNPEKRNEMIDKLKEEDAKYLLKICFAVMKGEKTIDTFTEHT